MTPYPPAEAMASWSSLAQNPAARPRRPESGDRLRSARACARVPLAVRALTTPSLTSLGELVMMLSMILMILRRMGT